ncbi:serine/threonine-protein kinase [Acaryochloris marina]|uniref:serine/threonine-protein kinase n=1 Tax=Acaryochloris marina TaxID=155978 RepID=UPI0021C3E426|nr:serine/threonine-protein kinase [Acaryochloris marina]BDM78494.1 serine/threonine protein kinase [Acaryochloris marina MBIC10699]
MEIYCTRPNCQRPNNYFADLDNPQTLKTVQQKFCLSCGMPLILIGRYLPSRLLAKGGFGAAYLACDRYTPGLRECVVKQFQPTGLGPSQMQMAQSLFQREAEVLEKLGRHPQIPDLFAFFELPVSGRGSQPAEDFFYLVQEFINGKTLEEELEDKTQFQEKEILELLQELLPVLQFVHENGSIHRDIKPSNIMRHTHTNMTQTGNGLLYLLDFGAVKQVANVAAPTPSKATSIYTPFYAPPEQTHGNQVFPSSDLYALAVTCIVLLTGKAPNDLFDTSHNQWKWRPYVQVSDRLALILDQILETSPQKRFQSAAEVLAALGQPHSNLGQPLNYSQPVPQSPPAPAPPAPAPAPSAPAPQKPTPQAANPAAPAPVRVKTPPPSFSIVRMLGGAAFTGFEGGLLAVALTSFLGTTLISGGFWLGLVAVLVYCQLQQWIERVDLVIIAGLTLVIIFFVPALQGGNPIQSILLLGVVSGLVLMTLSLVFRLIYGVLSQFL